jgi:LruC domain-containing protein
MKKVFYSLSYALLFIAAISCQKEASTNSSTSIPADFVFETSDEVTVTFKAPASLKGASFELYTKDPDEGGELFGKGALDASGSFQSKFALPTYTKSIYLKSTYIGLPGDIQLAITNGKTQFDFDTEAKKSVKKGGTAIQGTAAVLGSVIYSYLGSYDNQGVPSYLTTPDVVDQSLLADVNSSLPEGSRVPNSSPQYLANGNDTEVKITALSDAWVTFVSEGAGYRNVLAYYTYPTNNPPATANDIDSIKLIFPNASFQGSGGGLRSGDKVRIGRFPAGTSIGWVLLQNAWNGSAVNLNALKLYSRPEFNPEPNPADRQHNVTLYHQLRNLVLIGFEDIERNYAGCDQDFNDCVFYISTNPVTAIDKTNLPPVSSGTTNDDDNDGVDNNSDDYPNDPNKAFDQYYPNASSFASIAFEDLWPGMGDYDFNDLVMDVNYKFTTNASNFITNMQMKFVVRHIGASYHNGFGVEFPFPSSIVSQATGSNITDNLVTLTSTGVESGQTNATIIVFDDAFDSRGDTITINITLNTPFSYSQLNSDGLNPFIFVDGNRGREVHLMDHAPTQLADMSFFGTGSDDSEPSEGRYYRSSKNYPWAIEINNSYKVPTEKTHITKSYLKFNDWVNSRGAQFQDWYSNTEWGYRDLNKLQ